MISQAPSTGTIGCCDHEGTLICGRKPREHKAKDFGRRPSRCPIREARDDCRAQQLNQVKKSNFELETVSPTGNGNTTNTGHSARVQSVAQKGRTKNAKHSQDAGFQPQPFTDSKNQEHSTGYTWNQWCRDSALNFSMEPRICIPPWAGGVCSN